MKIVLENIGKRFGRDWIFRNLNYEFFGNNKYVILGKNGTGKSTLLQIIAGSISFNEGNIFYKNNTYSPSAPHKVTESVFQRTDCSDKVRSPIKSDLLATAYSFSAPYLELFEEMTWREAIRFQGRFKKYVFGFSEKEVIERSGLIVAADKQLKNFSSGMKQRARLTLAILTDAPLLLLDEPLTHLDKDGAAWYHNLLLEFAKEKLVIVCSNYNKEEYPFCERELLLGMKKENL